MLRRNDDTYTTPMGRKGWFPLIGGNFEMRNKSGVIQKKSTSEMYGHLRNGLAAAYDDLQAKAVH